MKKGRLQAKDIPDAEVFAVLSAQMDTNQWPVAHLSDIANGLPAYDWKLVLAKLRQLVKRELVAAECTCGCGGKYQLKSHPRFVED